MKRLGIVLALAAFAAMAVGRPWCCLAGATGETAAAATPAVCPCCPDSEHADPAESEPVPCDGACPCAVNHAHVLGQDGDVVVIAPALPPAPAVELPAPDTRARAIDAAAGELRRGRAPLSLPLLL